MGNFTVGNIVSQMWNVIIYDIHRNIYLTSVGKIIKYKSGIYLNITPKFQCEHLYMYYIDRVRMALLYDEFSVSLSPALSNIFEWLTSYQRYSFIWSATDQSLLRKAFVISSWLTAP